MYIVGTTGTLLPYTYIGRQLPMYLYIILQPCSLQQFSRHRRRYACGNSSSNFMFVHFRSSCFEKNVCERARARDCITITTISHTREEHYNNIYIYVCIGMRIIIIIVRIMPTSELTYLCYNMFNTCSVISRWSGNAAVGLTRRNNGAARNPRTTVYREADHRRARACAARHVPRPGQRARRRRRLRPRRRW